MTCVCGHDETDHTLTAMSVPLTRQEPIYRLPTSSINNVSTAHPRATYDCQLCWCGCHSYELL